MPPTNTNALITITTDTETLYVLRQVARGEAVHLTRMGSDHKAQVIYQAINELAAAMQEARASGHVIPLIYDWNDDDTPIGGG